MPILTVDKNAYEVDSLYQWDLNRVLEIRGLSVPSIPEIHFTHTAMDRAIVRQAKMDNAGIITVDVPNSLLQKPYDITVYVCIYEGDTFKSLYKMVIPVKARKCPNDYTFVDNGEDIYSFNKLENLVNNAIANVDSKYNASVERFNQAQKKSDETYNQALTLSKNALNESKERYELLFDEYGKLVDTYAVLPQRVTNLEDNTYKKDQLYTKDVLYTKGELYTKNEVYSKNEVYEKDKVYKKDEVYTRSEVLSETTKSNLALESTATPTDAFTALRDMSAWGRAIAFTSGNEDMVDMAFGKKNESRMYGLGLALKLYAIFKGGSQTAYESLIPCQNASDIRNSESALNIIKISVYLRPLILENTYAKTAILGYLGSVEVSDGDNEATATNSFSIDITEDMITRGSITALYSLSVKQKYTNRCAYVSLNGVEIDRCEYNVTETLTKSNQFVTLTLADFNITTAGTYTVEVGANGPKDNDLSTATIQLFDC